MGKPRPTWDDLSEVKSEVGMHSGITAVAKSLVFALSDVRNFGGIE